MYEFHGWFGLDTWTGDEETEFLQPPIEPRIEELKGLLTKFVEPSSWALLAPLNGKYFLTLTGHVNRRRAEAGQIDKILAFLGERLPGSYGLLYERDDETESPPGPNAFRVRVVARGRVEERPDPFLSPIQPRIED